MWTEENKVIFLSWLKAKWWGHEDLFGESSFISLLFSFISFYLFLFKARVVHVAFFLYIRLYDFIWKSMDDWVIENGNFNGGSFESLFEMHEVRMILLGVRSKFLPWVWCPKS